ncbi:MAG: NAD(P)-dependent oxidoreductase [Beijerinckiaceae bacterium]
MAKPSLGYIGVGLMGLPMVRHLVPQGYSVTAFDIAPQRLAEAASAGVRIAPRASDVVSGADIIVLNLPTVRAVERVMFGDGGVAAAMKPGQILVDFSTLSVAAGKAFGARLLAQSQCGCVDAPVSGGPPAAGTGALTVMVGGRPEDIEHAAPLLADVSQRWTVMGGPGSGLAAKMINQLIVGCTNAVLAEALMLAESAGIAAERLPECLAGGHADGTLLQRLYPRMAARDLRPQGYARQLLKDLEMVSVMAAETGTATPMMAQALQLFRLTVQLGHAEQDTSAIIKIYDRDPGLQREGHNGQ